MRVEIRNTTSNTSNWQDKRKILLNFMTNEVSKGATILLRQSTYTDRPFGKTFTRPSF